MLPEMVVLKLNAILQLTLLFLDRAVDVCHLVHNIYGDVDRSRPSCAVLAHETKEIVRLRSYTVANPLLFPDEKTRNPRRWCLGW